MILDNNPLDIRIVEEGSAIASSIKTSFGH